MVLVLIATALRGIAGVGSLIFLFAAGLFILAGCFEMANGRNAPGWLGGGFFYRRGWAREPHWSEARWRWNGFFVLGFGLSFVIVSLTLLLVAVSRLA
jgi:hypothetical protein